MKAEGKSRENDEKRMMGLIEIYPASS